MPQKVPLPSLGQRDFQFPKVDVHDRNVMDLPPLGRWDNSLFPRWDNVKDELSQRKKVSCPNSCPNGFGGWLDHRLKGVSLETAFPTLPKIRWDNCWDNSLFHIGTTPKS